jgi:hypothetical protein
VFGIAGDDVDYISARAGQIDKNSKNLPKFSGTGQKNIFIIVLNSHWHRGVTSISAFAFGSNIEFVEWKNTSYK